MKERNYILIYAYNKRITEEEGQIIREFAVSHNKKLIALSGEQSFCDEYIYCHPLEMLSYFKHADYVITDTFHGTIFSVINHRQFATLVRKDEEGMQIMRILGRNMAYYLKCIEAGKEKGIKLPEQEKTKFTNFIR